MSKKQEICTSYMLYESEAELESLDKKLLQKAQEISELAYAPYSNFLVSACLYLSNGEIVEGVNQENAAYPSGLCAERVAFFRSGIQYPNVTIEKVAILGKKRGEDYLFTAPCGACRQVMLEFEINQKKAIEVILKDKEGKIYKIPSIRMLLPFSFSNETGFL
ncbi:MAG: cytidine deaminase [Thermonemataceae bacterium]|nr:cytidine deaminase [Thermonemataceae bacterium]